MFEETLYQSCADGKPFVDVLRDQGIMPGIKVDGGLEVSSLPDVKNCVSACCFLSYCLLTPLMSPEDKKCKLID